MGEVGQKICEMCFCLKSGIIFRKQTLGPDLDNELLKTRRGAPRTSHGLQANISGSQKVRV